MLIEAAKGGHTNVVSILIDYPNSLVMTNEAAMSAAAFNDPINGPPQASIGVIHPANQATSHHLNASAVHAGQVSIGGQMPQEQMAIAMQHDQNNTQGIATLYFIRVRSPFHKNFKRILYPRVIQYLMRIYHFSCGRSTISYSTFAANS